MSPHHITCIYHKDCVDGTTAAAVVLKKYPHAKLFPLAHGYTSDDIAPVLSATPIDAHIYIVDSVLGIEEFLARGHSITVIDHHISAHADMSKLAGENAQITYIFDNARSGASLAWTYLFPSDPLPELITYVEDSDLWKQQFGTVTKDVAHYLSMCRNDPAKILALMDGDIAIVKEHGAIISAYTDRTIEKLVTTPPITIRIGMHGALAFNITDHESACGNILATRYDQAVTLFTIKGDEVKLSFRSLEHHAPSALDLALSVGGGGHKNAAGGRMMLVDFMEAIEYPAVHIDETRGIVGIEK